MIVSWEWLGQYVALAMPLDERKERWEKLNEVVKTANVEQWRANFVKALGV